MSFVLKDPEALLDYAVDWGAEYLSEDALLASSWSALAGYTAGGWRFISAIEGLTALDKASGELAIFRAGAWEKGHVRASKLSVGGDQVVGARQAAVADPSGGAIVDGEARTAIAAILASLRQHGLIAG